MADRSPTFVALIAIGLFACGTNETSAMTGDSAVSGGAPGSGGSVSAAIGGSGGTTENPPRGPTRYPPARVRSPLTDSVAERLRAIANGNGSRKNDVFMKVGDSHTVNRNFFAGFAQTSQPNSPLDPSIQFFRAAKLGPTTPFDRISLAAEVGKSANWAISGSPTPLEQEITATNPRFSLVMYGTNDMQMGLSYESSIFPFYRNLSELIDELEKAGIVPIVSGLLARADSASAALWIPTYDAVTRGIAEAHQIPYISLYLATRDLANQGLAKDKVHANVGGYDVRNLETMTMLDSVKQLVIDSTKAPDPPTPSLTGEGTSGAPFVIDRLPFVHSLSTRAGNKSIDKYSGCNAHQDEAGPERHYSLDLDQTTALRVLLFDRDGVDVDLHVLSGGSDGAACIARDDRAIERSLAAGKYEIVVDSFVSSGKELSGDYLLVVLACDPNDTSCK